MKGDIFQKHYGMHYSSPFPGHHSYSQFSFSLSTKKDRHLISSGYFTLPCCLCSLLLSHSKFYLVSVTLSSLAKQSGSHEVLSQSNPILLAGTYITRENQMAIKIATTVTGHQRLGMGKKNQTEPSQTKPTEPTEPIQTEPKSISNHSVEDFSNPNGSVRFRTEPRN